MTFETSALWDSRAATFDDEPDHGLRVPAVRDAWMARLWSWLSEPPARVLDLGCGTGSIAVNLSVVGYDVVGADLSREMLLAARRKATAASVELPVARVDAADPPFRRGVFEAILVRHLVWALPSADDAISRWATLLSTGGRLVMVEGHWAQSDGRRAGITSTELLAVAKRSFPHVTHYPLNDPELWGRAIDDERYAIVAHA